MPNGPWGSSSTPAAITPSFTDLVPGTSTTWGSITGAGAQASPAGGWTGDSLIVSSASRARLTIQRPATSGDVSAIVQFGGYSTDTKSWSLMNDTGANNGDNFGLYSNTAGVFVLTFASSGAATFSNNVSSPSFYSNGVQLITSDGTSNYLKTGSTLYIQNGGTTLATITSTGAVNFQGGAVSMGALTATNGIFYQSASNTRLDIKADSGFSPRLSLTHNSVIRSYLSLTSSGAYTNIESQDSSGTWIDFALQINNVAGGTISTSRPVSMGALTATTGQFGAGTRNFPLEVFATGTSAVIGLHKTDATTADWYLHVGRQAAGNFSIGDQSNYWMTIATGTGNVAFLGGAVSMGALTATYGKFNSANATSTAILNVHAGVYPGISFYRSDANANWSAIQFRDTANSGVNAQIGWSGTTIRMDATSTDLTGALTATTGAFSGNVQFGSGYTEFADRAAPGTFNSRYLSRSGNQLMWRYDGTNDGIIYHSGNIAQNASALMAVQAGLYVPQWVASLPGLPNAAYPPAIWNATTSRYDGGLVCIISTYAMYQNQGGSWVAVGSNWAIFGQVQIGQLAVASVAASALVSDLVMSTVIRTSGSIFSTSGTRYPTGVLMSGNAFTTYYQDGTQDTNCHLEIDGSVNIGGYKAAVIANRVMGNSPSWTSNSTWTCPEGITKVSLTLQGAGANGAAGVSVGNAGGGGGCGAYLQRSVTVTPGTVYYISFDSGTVNFRTGGYSGTILYSAAIGGAASAPTHGNNGSAYYQPTPELLVPIPTTAGIDGQPWTGSGPTINYGGAGGISPFDASGYGSGGKGQDILKAGGVSGVAGTGMPGFARIIY